MAVVELNGVTRTFGEFTALEALDLRVDSGELVSLLGPSGCGKTTALKLIAGFDHPSKGRIVIGDRDVTGLSARKRGVGMVFQAYSLFPTMTAQKNVEFGLRVRGLRAELRRKRAVDLLELVGLTQAAARYPHQLSGGMQQRVALARALAIEPRILLLDEPLSALDAKVRVQLRDEIRRLQKELGITTIYVTHDQEEALSVSDRVAVMNRGRIEQIGGPASIYGLPETPFVAEFIGTMNRIESVVTNDSGEFTAGETHLLLAAASGRRPGERVLLLVRPETVRVGAGVNGASVSLPGVVTSSVFLGAITRVRVETAVGELSADVPSGHGQVAIGESTTVGFDDSSVRVLSLESAAQEQVDRVAVERVEQQVG
jgi:putative spermidine/putrescine transport system ATP-binding protein